GSFLVSAVDSWFEKAATEVADTHAIVARESFLKLRQSHSFMDFSQRQIFSNCLVHLCRERLEHFDQSLKICGVVHDGTMPGDDGCRMKVDHFLESGRPFGHVGAEREWSGVDDGVASEKSL